MDERGSGTTAGRRWIPIALIVLASLIGFFSVFALWVKRQALETETWTRTSSELLENEEIRNAVADFLITELYANVDVEGAVARQLPPEIKGLAGPVSGGCGRRVARPRVRRSPSRGSRPRGRTRTAPRTRSCWR